MYKAIFTPFQTLKFDNLKNIIDHFKAGGLLSWSRRIRSFQICPSNWKDKVSKNRDDYNQTMNELSLGVTERVVTMTTSSFPFPFLNLYNSM